jgi:hypothetical protein
MGRLIGPRRVANRNRGRGRDARPSRWRRNQVPGTPYPIPWLSPTRGFAKPKPSVSIITEGVPRFNNHVCCPPIKYLLDAGRTPQEDSCSAHWGASCPRQGNRPTQSGLQ